MQGAYSPDVAELIKPSIAIYLYREALEEGFEPRLLVDENEENGIQEGEVDDVSFFRIMKQRNPDLYSAMNEQINYEERMEVERMSRRADKKVEPKPEPTRDAQSFLAMGEM